MAVYRLGNLLALISTPVDAREAELAAKVQKVTGDRLEFPSLPYCHLHLASQEQKSL